MSELDTTNRSKRCGHCRGSGRKPLGKTSALVLKTATTLQRKGAPVTAYTIYKRMPAPWKRLHETSVVNEQLRTLVARGHLVRTGKAGRAYTYEVAA